MSQTKVKSGLIDFTEGIDSFIEFSGGNSTVTGNLTVTGTLVGYTPTASLNISNWNTAYSYSQVGHLPLTGGTLTGQLTTSDTGTSSSIVITSDSIGNGAIDLTKNTNGTGIRITNNGVGSGIVTFNNSTGTGITIANTSTGKGLLIDNSSSTTGDPFVYTLGGAAYVKAKINYLGNLTLAGTITASGYNNSNWDTAYGWGNHASAGYLTSFDITTQTDAKYLRSDESDTMSGSLTTTGNITVGGILYVPDNIVHYGDNQTNIGFATGQFKVNTGSLTRLSVTDASVQVTNPLVASSTLSVTGNLAVDISTLFVDVTNNRVGIGTTSPSVILDVYNSGGWGEVHFNGTSGGELVLQKNGISYGNIYANDNTGLVLQTINGDNSIYFNNNGNPLMRLTTTGLGVGTTSPQAKLHISNSTSEGIILSTTTNAEPFIALWRNSANSGVGVLRLIDGGNLYFDNGATGAAQSTKMVITSSGNVGIGTSSPSAKLHVADGFIKIDGNDTDQYFFEGVRTGVSTTLRIYDNASIVYYDSHSTMRFRANQTGGSGGNIGFFGGNVGIGALSPNSKLGIEDTVDRVMNTSGTGQFEIQGNGYTFGIAMGAATTALYHNSSSRNLSFGTNETERLTITGSGNVGIGTTSPSQKLHVNGNILTDTGRISSSKQVIVSALNTNYEIYDAPVAGVITVRDNTYGGSGLWLQDPNGNSGAAILVASSWVNGTFSISYTSGKTYIQKNSGNVPVNINVSMVGQ